MKLSLTQAFKIEMRASQIGADIYHLYSDGSLTYGNSKTRTILSPTLLSNYETHDWKEVDDLY